MLSVSERFTLAATGVENTAPRPASKQLIGSEKSVTLPCQRNDHLFDIKSK
jgi:hypothetical protein